MSYTKQNYQSGEKLYASQLNNMDDQIALNDERLSSIEGEGIASVVDEWLEDNFSNPDSPPLDRTLTSSSSAAPADLVGELKADLSELEDGGYVADQQRIEEKINDWLDEHPESTTTVVDGSITEEKFTNRLKLKTIKDYVTPEMFGAVGDGENDDTNAFKLAIANGRNVFIPSGVYKLTEPLSLPVNRKLYGADDKSTVLRFIDCDGLILANYQDRSGIIINHLSIEGTTGIGLKLITTNNTVINNIAIKGFSTGVYLDHSVNNTFNNLFLILNTTGFYATGGSYYNKLYNCIITACGTGIDGGVASLEIYAIDIELSTTCDITGVTSIDIFGGHFEGHGSTPTSIIIGTSKFTLKSCYFTSYTTGILGLDVSNGYLYLHKTIFVNCTTDIDAPNFGYYQIEYPSYFTEGGGTKTGVVNVDQIKGLIIESVWTLSGYFYKINSRPVDLIKASGRVTYDFGTIAANTQTKFNLTIQDYVNAYTDFLLLSPNSMSIPAGIMYQYYITPSSNSALCVEMYNVTDAPINVGNLTFNYKIL